MRAAGDGWRLDVVRPGNADRQSRHRKEAGTLMSTTDKIRNATENATGKVKEATGRATGDRRLEAEGRGDQMSSNLKQAGEKLKDVFRT